MAKFSIIIPVYNVAPYLRECLESVLAQRCADWECICVDDGSTDGSEEILDEYARKDKRFRVFHKSNGGVSSARNVALDNVRGEWIWFVDGDDLICKEALEIFSRLLEQYPKMDALSFDCVDLDEMKPTNQDGSNQRIRVHESLSRSVYKRFDRGGTVTLFNREKVGKQRFQPYRLSEDTLFSLTYACKCHRFLDTSIQVYFRRLRLGSATRQAPDVKHVRDWFNAQKEILACIVKHKERFTRDDLQTIVRDMADSFYYTNRCRFFKLSPKEAKELLPLWMANFKALKLLGNVPFYQCTVMLFVHLLPSFFLARVLVLMPLLVKKITK